MSDTKPGLRRLAAAIVSAHIGHNVLPADELPDLIRSVYDALDSAGTAPAAPRQEPAVPVKRSVFPDYIICLEDGKELKMLKRHLQTSYGMTPEEYRAKWDLPDSYPMVAPNYAAKRSTLAKQIGLGRKAASQPAQMPPAAEVLVKQIPAGVSSKRAGRPRSAKSP